MFTITKRLSVKKKRSFNDLVAFLKTAERTDVIQVTTDTGYRLFMVTGSKTLLDLEYKTLYRTNKNLGVLALNGRNDISIKVKDFTYLNANLIVGEKG
jgi:hypothetical protein